MNKNIMLNKELQGRTAWLVRSAHNRKVSGSNPLLAILIAFSFIFMFSFVSADYLPHKQNTELNFSITSNFATSCELTTINTPNGIIEIGQTDTDTGTFNFNILGGNFSSLGTYCMNIVCTDEIEVTTGQECREVTIDGYRTSQTKQDNYYILLIGIALLFGFILGGVGLYYDKRILIFAAMAFLGAGLIISYYPSGFENTFVLDILSILNYGVAFLCLALGIYEWLPDD